MLGFYVLLEDQDANVIIALALHSALLQLGFFWKSWPTLYCWSEVRSVAQAAWQAPARLPAQLNAPHAHQSARFTACSASRRPAGSLRQAVLLNAAPAGSLAGALKLNAPQPRPLASGEDAAANRRCWSSYNSCQWVSDMVRFRGHVAVCNCGRLRI